MSRVISRSDLVALAILSGTAMFVTAFAARSLSVTIPLLLAGMILNCLMLGRTALPLLPFAPLGFGSSSVLADPTLARVAASSGCTTAQACLAWELALAPNLLLIPGTSSLEHLRENLASADVHLDERAVQVVSQL